MAMNEGLSNNVIPESYKLFFEPDLRTFKSKGEEEITVSLTEKTKKIRINSKEIEILHARAEFDSREITASVNTIPEREEIEFSFEEELKDKVKLKIEFVTQNNDRMYGFYRSKYLMNGKEEFMLSTDFEPTNARAAFPCFDEPAFKSTFSLSIKIDKALEAVSNTPAKGEYLDNDKKVIEFETTPRMSTYLFYVGVGKFDRESEDLDGRKISVLTTPGKGMLARTALGYTKKFLAYFEEYFGVRYPLPKLDLIAIPDFSVGAMENWGAITFRESRLLVDKKSSLRDKMSVAETVAHELAHQWFGDLVTMTWWDDLWLNESFATLMSYKAMENVFPEWEKDLEYLLYAFDSALMADGLNSTHPISVNVRNTTEIEDIFDVISYRKGGSVLRMLDYYAGVENFRKGLKTYLITHAYGNATKADLWKAVGEASHISGTELPIESIMDRWLNKPGYPIINVYEENKGFRLCQKRFLFSGETKDEWPVPVHYALGDKKGILRDSDDKILMLTEEYKLHDLPINSNGGGWIKLNYGQHGFYRVNYSEGLLEKLGNLIKSKKLPIEDAWGVENDIFALVRGGMIKTGRYLDFIIRFCGNCQYPLSASTLEHLVWLCVINQGNPSYEKIASITGLIAGRLLKKLGWKEKRAESTTDRIMRITAINVLGFLGDKTVTKRLLSIFYAYLKKKKVIRADLLQSVYSTAAINGDVGVFESLLNLYETTNSATETILILSALGKFRNRDLLIKALEFSKSEKIRLQDSWIIASAATYNPLASKTLWPWIKDNWKLLSQKFAPGTKILRKYVESLEMTKDREILEEISVFFSQKDNFRDELRYPLNQTLEKINLNIRYLRHAGTSV